MKQNRFLLLGIVFAVAISGVVFAQDEPEPRGRILVSSRIQAFEGHEGGPPEGCTPGDAAMLILLQNAGYRGKIAFDNEMSYEYADAETDGDTVELVVISGSSSSSNVQAVPAGIPVMMGEHVTLANPERAGYIGFYGDGADTGDRNRWGSETENLTQYMKVAAPNHPIMAGIETDADGLVKILRDPYSSEDTFSRPPEGIDWKKNYEFAWPEANAAAAAPGMTVLGVNPAG